MPSPDGHRGPEPQGGTISCHDCDLTTLQPDLAVPGGKHKPFSHCSGLLCVCVRVCTRVHVELYCLRMISLNIMS